ncbi:tetratricopeptide repeat family protein [Neokomagataea thailandica NBRC 106555]|uniref:Sel1 repeat family protein n=2 Tax=Neokomagataea TaxID=1223423 RepID=A0A4Y6V4K8_9PROT|nr:MULTISPECIES: SEL1-like repeat protein [Neokomagataea]QDH24863.1 hypothetical protein D5366_06120 [Neokomagataea tanensis]GBR50181.1 tetratricopeptide repeat family protein [Neokomagataea thailandica NBRC 106555]
MSLKQRFSAFINPQAKLGYALELLESKSAVRGVQLLGQLAKDGNTDAKFRLGRAYLDGKGVPPSLEDGARWMLQAAEAGHTEASFILATLYTVGLPEGFEIRSETGGLDLAIKPQQGERIPDFHQGKYWAQKAAVDGSADAQALLGYILTNGPSDLRDDSAAREWYQKSAQAGCSQGHLGLALALLNEADTDEKRQYAARHFIEASKGGLGTAFEFLGRMSEAGVGLPQSHSRAAEYYNQAAEKGSVFSQGRYGLMLLEGTGIDRHYGRAETWLRRAALNGDADSAAVLGDLNANGGDLPPNMMEAAKWYRLAAEQKHAGAARALGLLYLTGNGVHRDPDAAAHWFKIASESGDAQADADFGNLILMGTRATDAEKESLRQRFERSAEKGDLVGAFNLGVCYAEGVGASDNKEAARWMQRATDGVVNAQYWYGRMLLEGRGVAVDPTQALYWMEKAADAGMAEAQAVVGQFLVTGQINNRRDHAKALKLYAAAAESGNVDAMFSLAAMLGGGHDVPEDRPEAQKWFRKAAQRGNGLAQLMLGRYLVKGLAGVKDPVEGRIWIERAVAQGIEGAEQARAACDHVEENV